MVTVGNELGKRWVPEIPVSRLSQLFLEDDQSPVKAVAQRMVWKDWNS